MPLPGKSGLRCVPEEHFLLSPQQVAHDPQAILNWWQKQVLEGVFCPRRWRNLLSQVALQTRICAYC